ncbi:MAG: hypothetical protein ABI824_16465 [Acidobacteriota bacterium]
MNQSRSAIGLYMGLVLVCGAVLGVVGERYYIAETAVRPAVQGGRGGKGFPGGPLAPADYRKNYLDFMQKGFNLSSDQVTKLGAITDETSTLMDELHRRQAPEQQEIRRAQELKIRTLLTPAQQIEYDRRVERLNKDREERKLRNKSTFDQSKPEFDSPRR